MNQWFHYLFLIGDSCYNHSQSPPTHKVFYSIFILAFFYYYSLQWFHLSHSLSCDVHQTLLFHTDTKITKFKHQVVSIWFGLFSYLYCTDGFYSADTFNFFCRFWFMRFSELARLGHQRHTIPLYWLADCELHLEMWLIPPFFSSNFTFNSLTWPGTNTSLNQQCPTVVVIMKLSLMPTSFIKKTCGPEFPWYRNMTLITDTVHAKPGENCSVL